MNILKMLCRGDVPAFTCDAADFDGTNDWMERDADLTGLSDSRTGILSFWIRLDGGNGAAMRVLGSSGGSYRIAREATDKFNFRLFNAAFTSEFSFSTVNTYTASGTWLHVLASWDTNATAGNKIAHLYINDSSDSSVGTDTAAAFDIAYSQADHAIGAVVGGTSKLDGCLAEFYFAPGQFLDFSNSANRAKFISGGKPVDLGADGSTPTGTAPIVYQRMADGAAATTFATNLGSGGNFTITGSLDVASTSPSD